MKKYLLTLLFLFLTFFGFSQNSAGLIIKDSKPVKRVATTLDTIAIATKNSFIEPAPTYKSPPFNTEIGVTEGQLNVSLTGAATYNIPIATPQGINGVVPKISLVYNNQGGNGIAGYGWNIAGMSSITKIASTKFHDNLIDPVDFDSSDRYAFDGQRLMLKTGTVYGVGGNIYETENFSNVKISSVGINPSGANFGPASFLVEYPDGSIANYSTVTPTVWSITYWQNAQGVRINYFYNLNDNNLTINKITYGSTYDTIGINEINFDYGTLPRLRPEEMYIGGILIKETKLLQNINVKGNGINFRNYVLNYNSTSLSYQRLISITERCGDNSLALNPTVFSYIDTPQTINYNYTNTSGLPFTNVEIRNSATVSGDYNADGKMDFVLYPTLNTDPNKYKRFTFLTNIDGSAPNIGMTSNLSTPFVSIFPTKFITNQNKLAKQDGLTIIQAGGSGISVITNIIYDVVGNSPQNTKTVNLPSQNKWINGDFNGDGLTDLISAINATGIPQFVNLDMRDIQTVYPSIISLDFSTPNTFNTGDVNGDGKTDLMIFYEGLVKVYSLNDSNQLFLLFEYSNSNITLSTNTTILLGDFNGDGKTDFLVPPMHGTGITDWANYYSTGSTFVKTIKNFPGVHYSNPNDVLTYRSWITSDFDNDGKTDLIRISGNRLADNTAGYVSVVCMPNINGILSLQTGKYYFTNSGNQVDINKWALPIFYNSNQANRKLEIGFILNDKIHYFQSQKDFNEDKLMRSVTDGNGVIEAIAYKPLIEDAVNNNNYYNPNVYYPEQGYIENYPNTDIVIAPTFQVVKKLERVSADIASYKKQFFCYYGAVSNLEGLGFLGFRGINRTNWHTAVAPFYLISNISKYDISLRGANVENFSTPNYTRPNSTLSSFAFFMNKNKITYNIDNDTGVSVSPNLSNKVFKLFASKIESFDGLLGTSSETKINYDTFNNPIKSTVNTKNDIVLEKINITNLTYQNTNVAGSTYIIGRPLSKVETTTIYPTLANQDTFSTTELFTYTNNLLTRIRKRGNGSLQTIYETNEYDVFGNITKKIISDANGLPKNALSSSNSEETNSAIIPPGNPILPARITNYTYNPASPFNGRFLTSSADVEGLITNYNYNSENGTLISETNPYNLTTTYAYDKWFKKNLITDYLGNSTLIQYLRDNNNTIINTIPPILGSAPTQEIFNDLGLKIKSGVKNIDGNWVYSSNLYNIDDKITKTSEPYFGLTPSQWNESVYDSFGRVNSTIDYKNKTTSIGYDFLTTTINDGTLEKIIVKNSIGNIVSTTDNPGGTIINKYFANGNLKSSTYDNGGTTFITQDNWGRKITLNDPSAGLFSYSYNLYGEILTESNPNGITIYVYDAFGKVYSKKVTGINGDNTLTTNTYDSVTKLISATNYNDVASGLTTNYTFGYDSYKRPNFSDESGGIAYFQRATQYDSFGRPSNQLYTAINAANSTQRTDKWTCNVYKNGYLHQLKEGINGTGVVLHQTNSVNARGQTLTAQLANGITIANEYDIYGFPTKMQHDKGITNIMTLNNTFDNVRGNLKTRDNNLFGTGVNLWSEDFTNRYDSNDRLLSYKDQTGNYVTQSYNANGTINTNSVGANDYSTSKPFQPIFIPVTNPSPIYSYYNSRAQTIVYNSIKKPISITEAGQENINFEYNINGQRATMYYGNTNPDKMLRTFIKSYSADGSMEVRRNTVNNSIEFVTYLGGDAYSAPVMLKTDGTTSTLQNFLYLHRDYQGSILAITDNAGVIKEKRLFDAWGSLIKFWNATTSIVPITEGVMITDRGYTGHEHLLGVGLINMNGRLYDSILHRFLSPDNNLQDPSNTQNYNRYGYVLNNPLKYIDSSGENAEGGEEGDGILGWVIGGVVSLAGSIKSVWNESWAVEARSDASNFIGRNGQSFVNDLNNLANWGNKNLDSLVNDVKNFFGFGDQPAKPPLPTYQVNAPAQIGMFDSRTSSMAVNYAIKYDITGFVSTGIGTGLTAGEIKMYNQNTWFSLKQWKSYNQSFNGNGYTGGKIATASRISTGFKIGGYGLGAYSAISTIDQYRNNKINTSQLIMEEASNTYSTFGGLEGAAWGIGWEAGRWLTFRDFYQNWKQKEWLPWRYEIFGY